MQAGSLSLWTDGSRKKLAKLFDDDQSQEDRNEQKSSYIMDEATEKMPKNDGPTAWKGSGGGTGNAHWPIRSLTISLFE